MCWKIVWIIWLIVVIGWWTLFVISEVVNDKKRKEKEAGAT